MNNTYTERRTLSEYQAKKYVIPALRNYLRNKYPSNKCVVGTIESLHNESLAVLLDMKTGSDLYIQIGDLTYFAASRISPNSAREEFDIRYKKDNGYTTEYEKILKAMKGRATKPQRHIHTHINGNRLKIGIVDTDELFTYLENAEKNGTLQTGRWSDATYCKVDWDELERNGIHVTVIEESI